ncbi:MAG: hypothetical protein AAF617_13310, partial [Bacteroidota bacterium]
GKERGRGKCILKDDKMLQREFEILEEGEVKYKIQIKFKYNDDGLPSSIEQTDQDGNITKNIFKYLEFDDQNNWTKRLDYSSEATGNPDKVAIRTYEYY